MAALPQPMLLQSSCVALMALLRPSSTPSHRSSGVQPALPSPQGTSSLPSLLPRFPSAVPRALSAAVSLAADGQQPNRCSNCHCCDKSRCSCAHSLAAPKPRTLILEQPPTRRGPGAHTAHSTVPLSAWQLLFQVLPVPAHGPPASWRELGAESRAVLQPTTERAAARPRSACGDGSNL